jgi:transposase
MQLKTILNRIQKHRSFVYGRVRLIDGAQLALEVEVHPRANARARCSGCAQTAPGYDQLAARRFEFVPVWGIAVFLLYAMRRVACPRCGVKVESVPWGEGKHQLTDTYAWFLARWARRLSWQEVAQVFGTSWDKVFRSVEMAVSWGRAHQVLENVHAIGIDEIAWQHGPRFLTLVYQIDAGSRRLLWVGQERRVKTLLGFLPLVRS